MEEVNFESIEQLYNRLKPALRSKVKVLHADKKYYIKEEDVFEYLSKRVWNKTNNLSLDKMVNDILYIDNDLIDDYVQTKIIREKINKYESSADLK